MNLLPALGTASLAALLTACASAPPMPMPMAAASVDNMALPEAVRVPAGQTLKMLTTGVGASTQGAASSSDVHPLRAVLEEPGTPLGIGGVVAVDEGLAACRAGCGCP
jgi:hypothetical protein